MRIVAFLLPVKSKIKALANSGRCFFVGVPASFPSPFFIINS
jgi:hypothetical protein